jgi:hypothetical protein
LQPTGVLPDRPRPAWFGALITTLFVASLVIGASGLLRTPRPANAFENRSVAAWPARPVTLAEWRAFPATFERWFDDRFGMRARLVALDHWVRAVAFDTSPVDKVLIGRDGWLYFRGEDAKAFDRWYRGSEAVDDATIAAARDELVRRADFLASRGVPFVFVVVPEKYSVYPEYLPAWAATRMARSPLDRLVSELARNPKLRLVDLRPVLSAARGSERLYYKTDSHWNYLGATVGYAAMMREAARLLPGLTIAPVTRPPYVAGVDRYSGDLSQMLGLPAQFREDDIAPLGKILATPDQRCARREPLVTTDIETFVYRCASPPRYSAIVYRDSMGIPLVPMLAENFARTTFVTSPRLDPTLIDALKPDIVFEEMVERTTIGVVHYPMPR